jgi:hypothetical protein
MNIRNQRFNMANKRAGHSANLVVNVAVYSLDFGGAYREFMQKIADRSN